MFDARLCFYMKVYFYFISKDPTFFFDAFSFFYDDSWSMNKFSSRKYNKSLRNQSFCLYFVLFTHTIDVIWCVRKINHKEKGKWWMTLEMKLKRLLRWKIISICRGKNWDLNYAVFLLIYHKHKLNIKNWLVLITISFCFWWIYCYWYFSVHIQVFSI